MAAFDIPAAEALVVARTNTFRSEQRLAPLASNRALTAAARGYAEFLARSGKFAHEADGKTQDVRAKEKGYEPCLSAENLALNADSRGFAVDQLARDVVEGWKGSPGHRRNLMQRDATEVGVAIAQAPGAIPKYLTVQIIARPASLMRTFKIENRSDRTVEYSTGERKTTLEIRTSVTHRVCAPVDVVVHLPGEGWFATGRSERIQPESGAVISVIKAKDGKLAIERKGPAPPKR